MDLLRKIKKNIRDQRGAAMIWVLIVFMVVSIASMTIISIQHADIREIMQLENHLSAYYASLGGMELGLAALMSSYNGGTLFSHLVTNSVVNSNLADHANTSYVHRYYQTPYGISAFTAIPPANAAVSVEVRIYRYPDSDKWIVVESVGTDLSSGESATNYLRVNAANNKEVRRDGRSLADL